ncbi:hypothetical protein [Flaviramulus basaltis]|uniref:hypothetical protein n=1 Tax=Flaviramulus basaltis TaxID=369401 RepID=UPI0015C558D1|nr:hypothetical protein [Flaviramulus basaltis]
MPPLASTVTCAPKLQFALIFVISVSVNTVGSLTKMLTVSSQPVVSSVTMMT